MLERRATRPEPAHAEPGPVVPAIPDDAPPVLAVVPAPSPSADLSAARPAVVPDEEPPVLAVAPDPSPSDGASSADPASADPSSARPAAELVEFARRVAAEHHQAHGEPITRDKLRARLGISNQLASTLLRELRTTT
jgi:hypothetical protein